MRSFHIKSILLGIGIGMILTSVIGMIYAAGIEPRKDLSEEEVIRLARGLGMMKSDELFLKGDTRGQDDEPDKSAADGLKTPTRNITITINQGDTSEKVADQLLAAGLIEDRAGFLEKLEKSGLATRISVGEFKIAEGTGDEEIIKIITRSLH